MEPQPSPQMLIDTVTENDRVNGTIQRRRIFEERKNFRVAHVFLFNSKNQLLLQQLAAGTRHPYDWGSSVASYLFSGEDYEVAARRRLEQELGITEVVLKLIGKTSMVDEDCLKWISLFATTYDGPFWIDRSHIAAAEFVDLGEIKKMIATRERRFAPTFIHVFDLFLSKS